jgi:hypothetical protein
MHVSVIKASECGRDKARKLPATLTHNQPNDSRKLIEISRCFSCTIFAPQGSLNFAQLQFPVKLSRKTDFMKSETKGAIVTLLF